MTPTWLPTPAIPTPEDKTSILDTPSLASTPETDTPKKGKSKMILIVIIILLLILFAIGGVYFFMMQNAGNTQAPTPTPTTVPETPTPTVPDTTDSGLEKDSTTTTNDLNNLDSQLNGVNSALNDQSTNLQ